MEEKKDITWPLYCSRNAKILSFTYSVTWPTQNQHHVCKEFICLQTMHLQSSYSLLVFFTNPKTFLPLEKKDCNPSTLNLISSEKKQKHDTSVASKWIHDTPYLEAPYPP